MQRWEHCVLMPKPVMQLATPSESGWREEKIRRDESLGDKSHGDAFARTMYQLGLDGWEMVTVDGNGSFWFKRPIPESGGPTDIEALWQ